MIAKQAAKPRPAPLSRLPSRENHSTASAAAMPARPTVKGVAERGGRAPTSERLSMVEFMSFLV